MQFQTGLKNILDRAVLKHKEVHAEVDVHRLHRPGQLELRLHDVRDDVVRLPVLSLGPCSPRVSRRGAVPHRLVRGVAMTQTLIVHVIRTNLIPFIQSRASCQLAMTTLLIMGVGAYLPSSPLAPFLGFVPLPASYWALLALTQVVKTWLLRKSWI